MRSADHENEVFSLARGLQRRLSKPIGDDLMNMLVTLLLPERRPELIEGMHKALLGGRFEEAGEYARLAIEHQFVVGQRAARDHVAQRAELAATDLDALDPDALRAWLRQATRNWELGPR
ncbi:hypothetical protein ABZ639_11300 [Saccharomonospora sp. NPDC006951]